MLSVDDQWNLLRHGHMDQGLDLMQQSFRENPTPSTLMTMGLGYLWAGKHEETCKLFQEWMETYGVTVDAYFTLIGVAYWCLDDFAAAFESWNLGLRAQYIDMAGGIGSPLLLWVASVLRPSGTIGRADTTILEARGETSKLRHWPGPILQFVLGQIDEATLCERSKTRPSANMPPNGQTPPGRKWTILFYKCVYELERGELNREDFHKEMAKLVDTSSLGWSDEQDFLHLVRNPEFYIARHEASTTRQFIGE